MWVDWRATGGGFTLLTLTSHGQHDDGGFMAGTTSAQDTRTRTVLREATGPGPATVLVEANDRLQEVRSLLATVLTPGTPDTRPR